MDITEASRAELSKLLHSLSEKFDARDCSEDLEREADRHLQALRDSFRRVMKHGPDDVFVRYLIEQLETVASVFVEASGKSRLRVIEHKFQGAQFILAAFGRGKRLYRYTWRLNPDERLFEDPSWRKHFELTTSMAISGAIEICTIVIGESHQLQAPNVQKLLEFFASQEGHSAKIISTADWEACMADYAIPSSSVDIGIYGDNLLYQADTYKPVSIGSWSKDPVEIERFTHFFNVVWNTVAANNPASPRHKISLSQLMTADSAQDRRNAVHDTVTRIEEKIRTDAA